MLCVCVCVTPCHCSGKHPLLHKLAAHIASARLGSVSSCQRRGLLELRLGCSPHVVLSLTVSQSTSPSGKEIKLPDLPTESLPWPLPFSIIAYRPLTNLHPYLT